MDICQQPEFTRNGTLDFGPQQGEPAEKVLPVAPVPEDLRVANALPVQDLRQALSRKEFQKTGDSEWPLDPLRRSRGNAQLRPVEADSDPLLPRQREQLEEAMLAECRKLS